MRLSTKLPDEMSANERLKEIASILAMHIGNGLQTFPAEQFILLVITRGYSQ